MPMHMCARSILLLNFRGRNIFNHTTAPVVILRLYFVHKGALHLAVQCLCDSEPDTDMKIRIRNNLLIPEEIVYGQA